MKRKILKCKCHSVTDDGEVWTRLVQFSQKGKQGIQTKKIRRWHKLNPVITQAGYKQTIIHHKIWRVNRLIADSIRFEPRLSITRSLSRLIPRSLISCKMDLVLLRIIFFPLVFSYIIKDLFGKINSKINLIYAAEQHIMLNTM